MILDASVGWKQKMSVKSCFLEISGGLKDHILCYKHYKYSGCLHTKKKANRSIVRATQYTEYKPHLKMSKLVPTKTSINTILSHLISKYNAKILNMTSSSILRLVTLTRLWCVNVDIVDNKSVGVSAPGLLTPGTRVQMTEMMYRDDGDTDPSPDMQPMFDNDNVPYNAPLNSGFKMT